MLTSCWTNSESSGHQCLLWLGSWCHRTLHRQALFLLAGFDEEFSGNGSQICWDYAAAKTKVTFSVSALIFTNMKLEEENRSAFTFLNMISCFAALSGFAAKDRIVQLDATIDSETKACTRICMQHTHNTMTTSSLMILKYLCTLKGNTYRKFAFLDLCRVRNFVLVVRQGKQLHYENWIHRRFRGLVGRIFLKSKLFEETFCIAPLYT